MKMSAKDAICSFQTLVRKWWTKALVQLSSISTYSSETKGYLSAHHKVGLSHVTEGLFSSVDRIKCQI